MGLHEEIAALFGAAGPRRTWKKNLDRAVAALEGHIGRCAECRHKRKKYTAEVMLCHVGEELRRVVVLRRAPTDEPPR